MLVCYEKNKEIRICTWLAYCLFDFHFIFSPLYFPYLNFIDTSWSINNYQLFKYLLISCRFLISRSLNDKLIWFLYLILKWLKMDVTVAQELLCRKEDSFFGIMSFGTVQTFFGSLFLPLFLSNIFIGRFRTFCYGIVFSYDCRA